MRKLLILLALFASPAHAQNLDCAAKIIDKGLVIKVDSILLDKITKLEAQGTDVHLLTVGPTTQLDNDEKAVENQCAEWRSPNGTRKSNLLVIAASPQGHKMGIYYGNALKPALDNHWMRIQRDAIAPFFRTGDFTQGFKSGVDAFTLRIIDAHDQAVHPAVSTTNVTNQATDLHGLWVFLGWCLLFAAIIGIARLVIVLMRKRQERNTAQQNALFFKNRVAYYILAHPEATRVAEEFTRLAGSFKTDPATDGLTTAQYNAIGAQYRDLLVVSNPSDPIMEKYGSQASSASKKHHKTHAAASSVSSGVTGVMTPNYSSAVIINNIENDPYTSSEPSVPTPRDPDPEPVAPSTDSGGSSSYESSSSSSDSDSGGSSSWSSDSSSSSSFDSGSSSSFDSGSGGGDFGGGGGSSDF